MTEIGKDAGYTLNPDVVLQESGTEDPLEHVRLGVTAALREDYERGLIYLYAAYRRLSARETGKEPKIPAAALSYYGLCLAMHKGRVKEGAEFCQLALESEFYNPEHYVNLARIWVAGKSRRKAIDALSRGLAVDPRHPGLQHLRIALGFRKTPVLSFLHRDNPVNVALGRMRHSLKSGGAKKSKTK